MGLGKRSSPHFSKIGKALVQLNPHRAGPSLLTATGDDLRTQRWLSPVPVTTEKSMWKLTSDHSSIFGAQTMWHNGFRRLKLTLLKSSNLDSLSMGTPPNGTPSSISRPLQPSISSAQHFCTSFTGAFHSAKSSSNSIPSDNFSRNRSPILASDSKTYDTS